LKKEGVWWERPTIRPTCGSAGVHRGGTPSRIGDGKGRQEEVCTPKGEIATKGSRGGYHSEKKGGKVEKDDEVATKILKEERAG